VGIKLMPIGESAEAWASTTAAEIHGERPVRRVS
jgi:hypothetical protein